MGPMRGPYRLGLRTLGITLLLIGGLRAEGAAPSGSPSPKEGSEPSRVCQSSNALSAIACELRVQIPEELGQVEVASSPVEVAQGQHLDELALRLMQVVAGRFDTKSEHPPGTLAAARARSTKANYLLYLTPRVREGFFEVTADLYAVPQGFWDRFKAPPGPVHHVFASRRLDGEVGSFLPVPKLLGQVERKVVLPTNNVVTLSCADIDGDRSLELFVGGRTQLYVGRVSGNQLQAVRQAPWHALSPVSSAPLRQPLAESYVKPGEHIRVSTTDRKDLLELAPDLSVLRRTPEGVPFGDLGCTRRAGLGYSPSVSDCSSDRVFERIDSTGELDTIAGATLETPRGTVRVLASRTRGQSRLQLSDSDGRQAQLPEAGAQATLADLDHDGNVEVVSSKDTLVRSEDELRVHHWKPEGLTLAYSLAVPGGIDAVAACPLEDTGASWLVVASGSELWFVR